MNIPNINDLTIEQKVGQMCMFGFFGDTPSDNLKTLIHEYNIGNVIVFARNFKNAAVLRKLTSEIYTLYDIPPLISIDQEGGVVTRITEGASLLPGNMAVAATGDPANALEYGEILGTELRALGINLNLAPVLDINRKGNPGIGVRSFGENADVVSRFGIEVIKGLQKNGVHATAKHFPGIGSAELDTHFWTPVINLSKEQLEEVDLIPFKEAIKAGTDCVMTSHASFPAYSGESGIPATFSHEIMTELLRDNLGFEGVLITDDMEMGGAEGDKTFEESILAAVKAGADLVCVCHDFNKQKSAVKTIVNAVKSGDIQEERIDQSLERIFKLKTEFLNNFETFSSEEISDLIEKHENSVEKITTQSITRHGTKAHYPLSLPDDERVLLLIPGLKRFTPVEELKQTMQTAEKMISDEFKKRHENTNSIIFSLSPPEEEIQMMTNLALKFDSIVFCSYNAYLDDSQRRLISQINRKSDIIMLLMLREPYDTMILGEGKPALGIYSILEPSIRSGIKTLFGK